MSAKVTERKGSEGARSFVSGVKELRRRARAHIEQGAVTAGYRADRATRWAPDLIPESCTGRGGNEQREGAATAVSLHDTVGLTTLGGNGLDRPQGFPEWLPLKCWDVLTSWPTGRAARWTPSQGRRSVHIGDPSSMDIIHAN